MKPDIELISIGSELLSGRTLINSAGAAAGQLFFPSIGFYPGGGKVEIRLSATPTHRSELQSAEYELRNLLQDYLIS